MGDRTRYEKKTVKAVRGTDRIVVAQWEKRGWELIDQTPGTVSTALTFRRPKPLVTRQSLTVVAVVVALVGVVTIGALTEREDPASTPDASHGTDDGAANIAGFFAAFQQGDLQEYAQEHNADPMEFDAHVKGVGVDGLKTIGIINLRAWWMARKWGHFLQLTWGGFSQIPFPTTLEGAKKSAFAPTSTGNSATKRCGSPPTMTIPLSKRSN